MHPSARSSSLLLVIGVGVFYAAVGVLLARLAPDLLGRRLAWLVSAVAFAAHLGYEHFVRRSSPRVLAARVSAAAAIGAFGLAAAANLHGWASGAPHQGLLRIALVAWPAIVAVPAFVVALIGALIAKRVWPRTGA